MNRTELKEKRKAQSKIRLAKKLAKREKRLAKQQEILLQQKKKQKSRTAIKVPAIIKATRKLEKLEARHARPRRIKRAKNVLALRKATEEARLSKTTSSTANE